MHGITPDAPVAMIAECHGIVPEPPPIRAVASPSAKHSELEARDSPLLFLLTGALLL